MSYRLASDTLEELCGISISHTKIGDIADGVAGEIAAKQEHCPGVPKSFVGICYTVLVMRFYKEVFYAVRISPF